MSQAGSETMTVIPHSPAWYDRLAQEQVGYYIFHAYGSDEGVAIRRFRYIWKAIATK